MVQSSFKIYLKSESFMINYLHVNVAVQCYPRLKSSFFFLRKLVGICMTLWKHWIRPSQIGKGIEVETLKKLLHDFDIISHSSNHIAIEEKTIKIVLFLIT